ncbi:MAG: hypothetical protein JOZ29_13025 [Deltaproteobacteria bacterium]|nr:hypothetical protein [Deltaproteobacteria bacterium]MBV8453174.1 hypothetical protein [Deltaproteobacteria bacterium]
MLSVHVDSMFARQAGAEIDQRIGPEAGRLQALFDYSSYQLLRTDEADTPCGQEVAFILPAGRILHVRPMATHGNLIALELALFAGARAVMRTQLKMPKGGLLVLVGSQSPQEAYITSLTVGASGSLPATGSPGAASAAATPLPLGGKPLGAK